MLAIYQGALAEQFVGQELLTVDQEELYYWSRDTKSGTAEVDYLRHHEDFVMHIIGKMQKISC